MTAQAECLKCGCMKYLFDIEKGGMYKCKCGALNSKQAMVDRQKLKQKRLSKFYGPSHTESIYDSDAWDKAIAKEPTGLNYEEKGERVTV
jgi:hypothetical protein